MRAEGPANLFDAPCERRVADVGVGPEPIEELFSGDDAAWSLDQVEQRVEDLRLQRHLDVTALEPPFGDVQREGAEAESAHDLEESTPVACCYRTWE